MDEAERVPSRDDFKTAIICALPKEAEAVENLLSKRWKTKELGRHAGDQNMYTAGRIGDALVIVVWLDDYGRTKAASATAQLLFSFKNIEHALVVGICGGVPSPSSSQEITLGDIVISTELQQYDVGKQFPNGYRTGSRAKPRKDMRSFLHKLSTSGQTRRTLDDYLVKHLQLLLSRDAEYAAGVRYPGKHEDILHEPTYIHKHYPPSECYMCTKTETVCEVARDKPCSDLNCNTSETAKIIPRTRHQSSSNASAPKVHFGIVGSGDTVMKSAQHRDAIAEKEGIIAFEMEGAGVFEGINSIVVIKGVCDYADSHKNKKWQRYAATMAAACTGAFLELKEEEYGSEQLQRKSSHASIATMDSAVSNWSSSGNYYTSEPQLARHAIMDSGISSRSHSASNFTAGPPLSRHASDGGGIALSPHMRTANHPYHMGSPAERFREHRTQSWTSEPASYYGTPVDYGPPRNGWDSPNPMAQSRVSIPEVTSDAHLARSQTFPPQAHHQENTPTPAFPTLSTLSAHHQEDTTTPAFPTLSTLSLPDPSTAKPAEETARLILEACVDPTALTNLLADPTISLTAQTSRGKTVAHLLLGTANVVTNPAKMRRISTAITLLRENQIALDVPDHQGMTPLHWCVKTGNKLAAKCLVDIVNVNAVDSEGRTPLYLFGQDGSPVLEMGEVLLKAGAGLGGKKLPPLKGRPKEVQRTVRGWLDRVP